MITVATTSSSKVNYVEELEPENDPREDGLDFKQRSVDVSVRDWDVSDADALHAAAEDQLGEGANDDDWYAKHAMWFVNAKDNSAVLIVFRPKVEVKQ